MGTDDMKRFSPALLLSFWKEFPASVSDKSTYSVVGDERNETPLSSVTV
jgi:hypothetical protein